MKNCRLNSRHTNYNSKHNSNTRTIRPYNSYYDICNILIKLQDNLCAICGKNIDKNDFGSSYATLDHVIPLSLGGKDKVGNLVVVHKKCNFYKSNDIPTGCEILWLLVVNSKLNIEPKIW
jgi:5-methylcytosine-specific restriction endonuclease McrA